VRESGGFAMAVSDAALTQAVEDAARDDGLLLCPEAGATLAAWRQAVESGLVRADERAVLFNCATGLKYPLPDRSRTLDRHAPLDLASL
jgi:threonine synthase